MKIKVGVMSSMITFVGGFGVALLHLQIQSSMLRVGSFSGESAENKFDLKILYPIYSSCYSTFLAHQRVCHFTVFQAIIYESILKILYFTNHYVTNSTLTC